ncbi:MAG: glucosaminidase domain-containing protein [Spirochaetaceae bacterium]|jgi:hypothetical protein|nr:glucosaminidase domain-containing protein [Spirochaetaceae bacterium]
MPLTDVFDMRNPVSLFSLLVLWCLLLACAGAAKARPPALPEIPAPPEELLGSGVIPAKDLGAFLLEINPEAEKGFVEELAAYYVEEAALEGINHEVAFAQMCLETGFLRFGGLVTPEMNNFCGLGALGPERPGERFESPKIGVRAHIQHLKAYATESPLEQALVDPRYRYVRKGAAPTLDGLTGTWATDPAYAAKIRGILERLFVFYYGKRPAA